MTREHCLQGVPLPMAGHTCRQGRLKLLLHTPEGSCRFVLAEWREAKRGRAGRCQQADFAGGPVGSGPLRDCRIGRAPFRTKTARTGGQGTGFAVSQVAGRLG